MVMFLHEALSLSRKTRILDIGFSRVDDDRPYKKMLDLGLCKVVGIDASEKSFEINPDETLIGFAIKDGKEAILRRCRAPGMNSLLEPKNVSLKSFLAFSDFGSVISIEEISTVTLNDFNDEHGPFDFVKMDTQGSELDIIQHGEKALKHTVALQTEISFIELYERQATFGTIDNALRKLGFVPHKFTSVKIWPISQYPAAMKIGASQLLEADIVYIKDFRNFNDLSIDMIKRLAIILHYCYGSTDMVLRCLRYLSDHGEIGSLVASEYLSGALI